MSSMNDDDFDNLELEQFMAWTMVVNTTACCVSFAMYYAVALIQTISANI